MAGDYFGLMNRAMILPFWILTTALYIFIGIGALKIFLKMHDRKSFEYSDLWSAEDKTFVNFLLGMILYMAIVVGGLILFIVPGIYWGVKYSQMQYLLVDKQMKPKEALKESARITKGSKWNIFFFMILVCLINILGAIIFGIGLLWTIPATSLASVYVYKKLESKIL